MTIQEKTNNMEKIYIIEGHGVFEYLLKAELNNKAFRDKNKCEEAICEIAKKEYGEPKFSENSKFVKIVKKYWEGDFSFEEAEEMLGNKSNDAFKSAQYYDMKSIFHIREYTLV